MKPLFLAYYGDDFTGSSDALDFLTRAGARTVLFTGIPKPETLARFEGLDAIGVAGCTRALAPDAMERELRPAFASLKALRPAHVHYKVCSTFDSSPLVGSIGRAIEVGAATFCREFVPLVVGTPALGRFCVFGNLFARGGIGGAGAIYRLDRHPTMSRHPVTPADESDLRRHLARQTKLRTELINVLSVGKSEAELAAELAQVIHAGAEVILFDVLEPEHLRKIGAVLDPLGNHEQPLFSVGSSAIEMALGAHRQATGGFEPRTTWPEVGPASCLLAISGSCSPVTIGQIDWARRHGFAEIPLPPSVTPGEIKSAIRDAIACIQSGVHTLIHSQPERAGAALLPSAELGAVLGRVAREVVTATAVRRLLLAGGDTSSYAARALGIEAVEMIAPLVPGAPLCRAHAASGPIDGLEVNFKGGQVGAEDYFGAVARGRL